MDNQITTYDDEQFTKEIEYYNNQIEWESLYKKREKEKEKRQKRIAGDIRHKNRVKELSKLNGYPSPAMAIYKEFYDDEGNYHSHLWEYKHGTKSMEELTPLYYKRCYMGSHKNRRRTYYKNVANRKVRRCSGMIANGSGYKKCYEYWWEVC